MKHAAPLCGLLGLVFFGMGTPVARAQEKDPIDEKVEKWMEQDDSTAGHIQALDHGVKLWDEALNEAYTNLLKKLPKPDAEALKVSQRQWIAYRDANLKAIQVIFGHAEGTMYRPMAVAQQLEIIKQRVLSLRGFMEAAESKGD